MATTLTEKAVAKAKAGVERKEIPDGGQKGLYLVIQPSGYKSWAFRYRFAGKARKHTIGDFPSYSLEDARTAAGDLVKLIDNGLDPILEIKRREEEAIKKAKEEEANEFSVVWSEFIEKFAIRKKNNKPRTLSDKESVFRLVLLPAFGGRTLSSISSDE